MFEEIKGDKKMEMASTTLFAPQVRSVQPAFVYNETTGSVKIYYSLSEFNKEGDYNSIRYKIIDPNRAAGWGTDSMLNGDEYIEIDKPSNGIIEINLLDKDNNGDDKFKVFTVNQYYQVQLQLVKKEEGKKIEKSAWSQVTLIRPIPAISEFVIELGEKNIQEINKISGEIKYVDDTTVEAIKNYYVVIKNASGVEVFRTKQINNVLGTKIATRLHNCFLSDGNYFLSIEYTTINGYSSKTEGKPFTIGISGESAPFTFKKWNIANNTDIGSVSLEFKFASDDTFPIGAHYQVDIQRTSEKSLFKTWTQIKSFLVTSIDGEYKYEDFSIESETVYRYRLIFRPSHEKNKYYLVEKFNGKPLEILTKLENIHLLGKDKQLSIKYNPNISGFKYVTQENIANTLGGKYPIVRINGDTKYRQFSLSGTLSFNADYHSFFGGGLDSRGAFLSKWMKDDTCTLLFNMDALLNTFSNETVDFIKNNPSSYLEKKYRSIAMEFLTDQQPKLFRGMAEETMIVYLSNVSFTPNKQLSREVWDFSCTVTEICEYNRDNLIKYGLLSERLYTTSYILKMAQKKTVDSNGIVNVTDYVPLSETIDNIPILRAFWTESKHKGFDDKI